MKQRIVTPVIMVLLFFGCASWTTPRLTEAQVIKLADSRAAAEGYDLQRYNRDAPKYHTDNSKWSVVYRGKTQYEHGRPLLEFHDYFWVDIVDITKYTTITSAR